MDPLIDEANHVDFITLLDAVFADLHNPCSISQKQHRAGPLLNRSSDPRAAAAAERHAKLTSWDEKEYFHYRPLLSASYARILSAKNNPAEMICDLVREHSRIYPRPVTIGTFQEEPFNLKPEELQELMQSFPKDPKKSDIKFTTSSLGTVFLYSNKYLEDDYADFLAQYLDVDQVMSP